MGIAWLAFLIVVGNAATGTAGGCLVAARRELVVADRRPIADERAVPEFTAVGEHDFADAPDGLAGLGGIEGDGRLVAVLDGGLGPAVGAQRRRGIGFGDPVLDSALVIRAIEKQQRVRIAPVHLGDGDVFERGRLGVV